MRYTDNEYRNDLYESINGEQTILDILEAEADAISKGTSYLVEDFTSADSEAMSNRMEDAIYMESLQNMANRIRDCAKHVNSVSYSMSYNVVDPSAQSQIMFNELSLRLYDLSHSLEVSYNNIRLLYLYIKGDTHVPEAHTMPMVVIPYLDFVDEELPEDKPDTTNEESPEEDNTYLKGLNGDFDGDQVTAEGVFSQEANEEEPDDSVASEENSGSDTAKAEYLKISFPVDKKIIDEAESLYPKRANDSSDVKTEFDKKDIEKIIADRMREIKEKGKFEVTPDDSSDKDEKIDRNTWVIGGVVADAKYLPVKTDDPKETWIVWPNYESDLESEFETHECFQKFMESASHIFVRYDQEAQKWVNVQSDENVGLTADDVALYVRASIEAGCFGKVSKYEYLPKYGRIHSMIYCEENNTYYKYDLDTPEASEENPKPKLGFGWFAKDSENSSSDSDVVPNP